jgi:hypothetical protein
MKFYSEKLNKLFDTETELVAAEKAVAKVEAEKEAAAKQKKAEAQVVEDAFKARNAARREYNAKVVEAKRVYNTAVMEAKKAFDAAVAEATKTKDEAEKAYDAALKEFTAKHKSYHMTLKDGDNVITISNASEQYFENMSKEYNEFLSAIANLWKF